MKSKIILLVIMVILMLAVGQTALADMGPKPSLTVKVTNLPDGEYYIDLLVLDADGEYSNLGDESEYNTGMLNILKDYDEDGYRAAMSYGTIVPIFGDITCEVTDGTGEIHYSYMGIPEHFKLIIVASDLTTIVSPTITTFSFESTVTFDGEKNSITENNVVVSYGGQFVKTFFGTILLELLILYVFKFSIKENWKVFLIINFITQMVLTIAVVSFTMMSGILTAFIVYLVLEPVIFTIEAVLFTRLLKEHKKSRRILYAIVANLFSFGLGIVITVSALG